MYRNCTHDSLPEEEASGSKCLEDISILKVKLLIL
jgi:hypothetical protein